MRMLGQRPLVSFIVSVYNLERYIGACLDSIINQPFDDYEIVLVNNSSTDGSDAICREYAARNKQIRYYALNGEPIFGRAVMYGTQKAQGQYIHYVDGDDMLAPGAYGEIVDILRNQAPDVLFGRFSTIIEENIFNITDTPYQTERINGRGKDQVLAYLAETQPFNVATWRLIFSRKLREPYSESAELLKTPANIYGDVYVSIRTLLAARSVHYVDTIIYLYRVHSSSISRMIPIKVVSECCKLLRSLERLMRCRAERSQERSFVHVYMEQFRFLLVAALCIVSNEQINKNADPLDKYLPQRAQCLRIVELIAERALAKGGDIYFAPAGHIGLYLKTAFAASGLSLSGFFDNDVQKNGMLADGIPVRLPGAVTEITGEKPITILIGSGYPNVREELRRQFIALGIDESDLLIIKL